MREIKFRVWLDLERGPIYVPTARYHIRFFDEGAILEDYSSPGHLGEDEIAIVEQYTGLKDKNGVEIYEGDIVLEPSFGDRLVVYWFNEVCYDSGGGCAAGFYLSLPATKAVARSSIEQDWNINLDSGCEVIGNINENPELLAELEK